MGAHVKHIFLTSKTTFHGVQILVAHLGFGTTFNYGILVFFFDSTQLSFIIAPLKTTIVDQCAVHYIIS